MSEPAMNELAMSGPATISDILTLSARRDPARAAVAWNGQCLDYAALDAAASRFANALGTLGLAPGARVAIQCSNRPEYAIAHFGIARAGLVSAHLSPRYTAEETRHALALAEAAVAVVETAQLATLWSLRSRLPRLGAIVSIGGGDKGFDDFIAGGSAEAPKIRVDPQSLATITFTGGTTGLPKGALHSHAARVHWGKVAIHDFKLDRDEIAMVAAPLYHAAGGFIWFQPTLMAGGTCVLMSHWNVAEFVAEVARRRGTGAFMVPAQLSMLLDDPAFDAARLASLRKIVYGAAPSPPELIARAERLLPGCELIQNFGQTETGPLITQTTADRRRKPDSLGRPSPHVEVAILDASGSPAAAGEAGEIAARGVHVMSGYLGDDAANREFFRFGNGWGLTGDIAVAGPDGLITMVDRAKDVIIAGGVNIYPAEIERILAQHPEVADCAAFGTPDARWGELPVAVAVLARGATASPEELAAFCAERMARHKRPRRIEIVEAVPRTAAGKILRKALKERFG
jgi:acyl-CoA synthetase (AMP-forming)/AMP-acid ligase II